MQFRKSAGLACVLSLSVLFAAPVVAQELAAGSTTYTCCNLRYDQGWISDANWHELPFYPAGSRIAIRDYRRGVANAYIEGKAVQIGQEYGNQQESERVFVERLIVKEDPRIKLATWTPDVQAAVRAGKVMKGMNREQVIMSLGYPRADATPNRDAHEWAYWTYQSQEYTIVWDGGDLVKSIEASLPVKRQVVYSPGAH